MRARMRLPIASVIACFSLSGCGVYLHQPELETATKAIKANADALNAPAYFTAQEAERKAIAGQEDLALVRMLVANRDIQLLNVAEAADRESSLHDQTALLADFIEKELQDLAGKRRLEKNISDPEEARKSGRVSLQTAAFVWEDEEARFDENRRRMSRRGQAYRAAGGEADVGCGSVLKAPDAAAAESAEAQQVYGQLRAICQRLAVDSRDCALGLTSGNLYDTCERIAGADATIDERRLEALNNAKQALRAALARPRTEALKPRIEGAIRKAEAVLSGVAGLSTDEQYASVLTALNDLFQVDLAAAIQQVTSVPEDDDVQTARTSLLSALRLIDAIDAVNTPDGDPLDEPNALLIGIAKTQHDIDMVTVDIGLASQLRTLQLQEVKSLRTAVSLLARAQATLCNFGDCMRNTSHTGLAKALSYHIAATNRGTIPYKVLQFREIQAQRLASLQAAKLTEADWRALIKPAIDELALYGAGGLTPDVLGPFLSSLPITGAILGK